MCFSFVLVLSLSKYYIIILKPFRAVNGFEALGFLLLPLTLETEDLILDSVAKEAPTKPTYYPDAVIECACGHRVQVGSTQKEIRVEICSACHPLFTGQAKLIDKAGRLERFQKRLQKTAELRASKNKKTEAE